MFERATRERFRYESAQGTLSVEDLWDLPLTTERSNRACLDDIAKGLNKQLKAAVDEESFVKPKEESADTTTPAMFEIVKHIIQIRLAESEARRKAKETREKKQKIMALISEKQDEKLKSATIEELQAQMDAL
jgi:hypothetical protein